MNVAWRFHHNGYGQGVGLNEGGVETFKDNPDASLQGKFAKIQLMHD